MSETDLKLDPRRTAIVVIDLQIGIIHLMGAAAQPVANATRMLVAARQAGAQPVLVHVGGSADGAHQSCPRRKLGCG